MASVVIARLLGRAEFGGLGIIQSTLGMFGPLAAFGLGMTATKHIAEFKITNPARASQVLSLSAVISWIFGALVAAVIVIAAPKIATDLLKTPQLVLQLKIASLILLFDSINGAQMGALAGFEAFKRIAKLNLYYGLVNVPSMVVGCWLWGLTGAVMGSAVGSAFLCAATRLAVAKEARRFGMQIWTRDWTREMKLLWRFSLPVVVAAFVTAAARWASNTLIVREPGGLSAMGLCAVGSQVQLLVLFLPGMVSQASFPILSELSQKGEWLRTRRFIYKNLLLNLVVTTAFCAVLVALAGPILRLYGPSYVSETKVLSLFIICAALMSAARFLSQVLVSQNAIRVNLITNVVWGLLLIGTVAAFPLRGAYSLAVAQLVAYSALFLIPLIFLTTIHRPKDAN